VRFFACPIVAVLLVPRIAAAEPTVSVLYKADAACPRVSAFLDEATEKSGGVVLFAPTADPAAQAIVALAPGADGFTGHLSLNRRSGAYVRELVAPSCDDLAQALAFVLGLAVVEEYGEKQPASPPAPPPAPAECLPAPAPPPARSDFWLGGDVGVRTGISSEASLTEGAVLDWRTASGRAVRVAVERAEPNRMSTPAYAMRISWTAARAEVCPFDLVRREWLDVRPCGALDAGSIRATGSPTTAQGTADSQTRLWLEAGALLRLEARPVPAVSIELGIQALFPLAHYTFYFDNPYTQAHKTPYLAGGANLGLTFRIR
jgi:hypothetical protein